MNYAAVSYPLSFWLMQVLSCGCFTKWVRVPNFLDLRPCGKIELHSVSVTLFGSQLPPQSLPFFDPTP
jgi:hypothetical protein